MPEATLSELDSKCVRQLAKLYQAEPLGWHNSEGFAASIGLTADVCEPVLLHLKSLGLLEKSQHTSTTSLMFRISARVLQAERQLDAALKEEAEADRVERATSWVKSNPWTAYPLLALIALASLVALVNQLLELLEKIGIIHLTKIP